MALKKIIIVDDEPDIILSVKQFLEKSDDGYEIICTDSARQCLDLLNKDQIPDLIILDIMMPEMTGWEFFDTLKENSSWANIPVVFLTAKTDAYSKKFGSISGNDYIKKPFDLKNLKERIDKILKNTSQKQSL